MFFWYFKMVKIKCDCVFFVDNYVDLLVDDGCFSLDFIVKLENGVVKWIRYLKIGDSV